jgi:uncharacterized membrane protein YfcA
MDLTTPTSTTVALWRPVSIGLVAGMLSGLLGIGGGMVTVPALMVLMSMDRRLAHGTSLAATLPVAASSLATYTFNDNVDWPIAAFLAGGAIVGAIVGTHLLQIIPKRPLTIIFVATLLLAAARLLVGAGSSGRGEIDAAMVVSLVAIGFASGTLSGLLGIGGGIVMVPAMIVFFAMAPVLAKGTSVAVIVPTALTGTLRNRANRNADIRVAAAIGFAGMFSAVVGGMVSDVIDDDVANALFATLLVLVATLQIGTLRPAPTIAAPIEP